MTSNECGILADFLEENFDRVLKWRKEYTPVGILATPERLRICIDYLRRAFSEEFGIEISVRPESLWLWNVGIYLPLWVPYDK